MNKNIFFIFLIIIFFAGGIGLGYLFFNKNCLASECKIDKNNTYAAGWEAAKKRLDNLGIFSAIDKALVIKEINGTVEKVENNELRVGIIPFEPLADPDLDIRIVKINNDTQILKVTEKQPQEYEKDIEEYKTNRNLTPFEINSPDSSIPPSKYKEEKVSISEIKVRDKINIKTGFDIKEKKEFIAKIIIIQPK